jgi:hypothetical protein
MTLASHKNEGRSRFLVIANSYSVAVRASDPAKPTEWTNAIRGDVGHETVALFKSAAQRKRLFWVKADVDDPGTAKPDFDELVPASARSLAQWVKNRDRVTGTGGRHGEINPKTRFEVASLAAWHCQFDGCGEDLREHFVPGVSGNFGYFAPIVASSSDGPRGDAVLSPQLAEDPGNIMLMCDKCHRLIDRVAPLRYSRDTLVGMRRSNLAEVKRLLNSLRFPSAQMFVIGGSIEGQTFAFDERVAEEAMWLQQLRRTNSSTEWFARNSPLGKSSDPNYWASLFELLKWEIPRIRGILAGTSRNGGTDPALAVFPLHGTSVLILFGRLIGEARSVHPFQFHRDQISGNKGGQWAWPRRNPSSDKYRIDVLEPFREGASEAILHVNLTARIPGADLPSALFHDRGWTLPAIEVTAADLSHRIIGDLEDLELFGRAFDSALRILQDEWRVRTVHLVVVAPVTACFRIGQKMQARIHADFILYERTRQAFADAPAPFGQTIRISSNEVTSLSTGESLSLS